MNLERSGNHEPKKFPSLIETFEKEMLESDEGEVFDVDAFVEKHRLEPWSSESVLDFLETLENKHARNLLFSGSLDSLAILSYKFMGYIHRKDLDIREGAQRLEKILLSESNPFSLKNITTVNKDDVMGFATRMLDIVQRGGTPNLKSEVLSFCAKSFGGLTLNLKLIFEAYGVTSREEMNKYLGIIEEPQEVASRGEVLFTAELIDFYKKLNMRYDQLQMWVQEGFLKGEEVEELYIRYRERGQEGLIERVNTTTDTYSVFIKKELKKIEEEEQAQVEVEEEVEATKKGFLGKIGDFLHEKTPEVEKLQQQIQEGRIILGEMKDDVKKQVEKLRKSKNLQRALKKIDVVVAGAFATAYVVYILNTLNIANTEQKITDQEKTTSEEVQSPQQEQPEPQGDVVSIEEKEEIQEEESALVSKDGAENKQLAGIETDDDEELVTPQFVTDDDMEDIALKSRSRFESQKETQFGVSNQELLSKIAEQDRYSLQQKILRPLNIALIDEDPQVAGEMIAGIRSGIVNKLSRATALRHIPSHDEIYGHGDAGVSPRLPQTKEEWNQIFDQIKSARGVHSSKAIQDFESFANMPAHKQYFFDEHQALTVESVLKSNSMALGGEAVGVAPIMSNGEKEVVRQFNQKILSVKNLMEKAGGQNPREGLKIYNLLERSYTYDKGATLEMIKAGTAKIVRGFIPFEFMVLTPSNELRLGVEPLKGEPIKNYLLRLYRFEAYLLQQQAMRGSV